MAAPDTRPVAVVTGASSGIGRAVAIEASRRGFRVVAAARRTGQLERTLAACPAPDPGRAVACDVTDHASVAALAASVAEVEGRCDLLVANAGVGARQPFTGPESLDRALLAIDTNLGGATATVAHLLPLLRAAPGGGAIVGVSSVAGLVETPMAPAYAASKAGLTALLGSLQPTLARDGITVAAVHPGPVPTEGFPQARLVRSRLGRRVAGTSEQVARVVLDAAAGRTGSSVVVPRGWRVATALRAACPPLWRALVARAAPRLRGEAPDRDAMTERTTSR